ncbi:hypothetical protein A3D42_03130 [Candidatus Nomurabacteria bacterium RIFCSPHIGHO2_02_FULL_41_18]|uniref:Uncharacterized protein n=1 Tax=Candidatus Nomurabacteria bacterium RIFCSPHIGHO2_02_FULL_41_18 TaxID=1801754 RepID=A0A1F6W8C4_9BACT|nr:MAG: hypothetical protein A3D42_03130 [Candidatus Nomurabacteria bacterium RIFCSPHIGHO2_02_FULL_41_18]
MFLFKKVLWWVVVVLAVGYIILVIVRAFHFYNLDKTNEQVEKIHNTRLQLSDVMGENLPPDPGTEADKTIAGVDTNQNGIRDDVELAIFKEYPNSAKKRAVSLQYALALQKQMILPIVNTETLVATVEYKSKASKCMWTLGDTDKYKNFIDNLQVNTKERNQYLDEIYDKLGSFSVSKEGCDLDLSTLPN